MLSVNVLLLAAPPAPPVGDISKVAPGAPQPQSGRGNLLDEIRRGKELKSAVSCIAITEQLKAGKG